MFNMLRPAESRQCDGTSRRDFMQIGTLGVAGLTLPDLLRARAAQTNTPSAKTRSTSVVWLWLGGGPTHVETFDPKPDAPVEFRSTVGSVKTKIPGIELGSVFPKLAGVMDHAAVVRSFAHRNSGHGGGTHFVMTGYDFVAADNGGTPIKPGHGATLARHRGPSNARTGLPTYIRMSNILADGPSWLGTPYAPFDVGGKSRQNMNLSVAANRVEERRNLMKSLDDVQREIDRSGLMAGMDSFETQAFDLILSQARDVFDLTKETPAMHERYGKSSIGDQLLMARRLCQAGVGFVTLNYGGWDMHGNIAKSITAKAPPMDQAISAFIQDTVEQGMDKDVLLVITGEFGRTPRINMNAGRDHWAPLSTLALAGGGLRMGQAVGESTSKAETPKSKPISPQDLMATVYHVLGIPQDLQYNDNSGRPMSMITSGQPIRELVG